MTVVITSDGDGLDEGYTGMDVIEDGLITELPVGPASVDEYPTGPEPVTELPVGPASVDEYPTGPELATELPVEPASVDEELGGLDWIVLFP